LEKSERAKDLFFLIKKRAISYLWCEEEEGRGRRVDLKQQTTVFISTS